MWVSGVRMRATAAAAARAPVAGVNLIPAHAVNPVLVVAVVAAHSRMVLVIADTVLVPPKGKVGRADALHPCPTSYRSRACAALLGGERCGFACLSLRGGEADECSGGRQAAFKSVRGGCWSEPAARRRLADEARGEAPIADAAKSIRRAHPNPRPVCAARRSKGARRFDARIDARTQIVTQLLN